MLYKMPGDEWQRFANLRLLYTMMFTYPGKKLLFMGCEFAQGSEWQHAQSLDWHLLQYPFHQGMGKLVADLNRLYREHPALHELDFNHEGFEWIDCHDWAKSVLIYLRRSKNQFLVMAFNFTPVVRHDYRIGVPEPGTYRELFNSDSAYYGGGNVGNGPLTADAREWMGRPYSISISMPPLGGVVFVGEIPEEPVEAEPQE